MGCPAVVRSLYRVLKSNALSSILGSGYETLGHTDAQPDDRVPRKVFLKEQGETQMSMFYLTRISTEQNGSSNNSYGLYSVDTHF
jgi:hypothetical protein